MSRKKKEQRQRMWGFASFELSRNKELCRELAAHPEAVMVLLNLRAQMNGLHDHDNAIPWGYKDGPFPMRTVAIDRGRFHAIRLGLIEIVEKSVLADIKAGKRRKTRYAASWKWTKYDPDKPGKFIQENSCVNGKWKQCFDEGGRWKPEWSSPRAQKQAPYKPRTNNFPVRTCEQMSVRTCEQNKGRKS